VFKLRPVPESLPDRWMTGTQNHEGLAGVRAAIDYLAEVGVRQGGPAGDRRKSLRAGLTAIQTYEAMLADRLLQALADRPRFRVWGIADRRRLAQRVPTIAITLGDRPAGTIAEHLAARQIFVWSGDMYAVDLIKRLGLEQQGGILRIGLVHYNTAEEVDRLLNALDELK
jgi:selenocysteine lyase/cysteine desulfurase